jgi:hypothetical protein
MTKVLLCRLHRPETNSTIAYRLPNMPRAKVAHFVKRRMPGWTLGAVFENWIDDQRWPKKGQEHAD